MDDGMTQDLDTTYIWLDQLKQDLIEEFHERDWVFEEEIDRDHLKNLIKNLEHVEATIELMRTIEDPRGK